MLFTSLSPAGAASKAISNSSGLPSRTIFSVALPPTRSRRIIASNTFWSPGCEALTFLPLTATMTSPTSTPALSAAWPLKTSVTRTPRRPDIPSESARSEVNTCTSILDQGLLAEAGRFRFSSSPIFTTVNSRSVPRSICTSTGTRFSFPSISSAVIRSNAATSSTGLPSI